jgi:hypothetical protein
LLRLDLVLDPDDLCNTFSTTELQLEPKEVGGTLPPFISTGSKDNNEVEVKMEPT